MLLLQVAVSVSLLAALVVIIDWNLLFQAAGALSSGTLAATAVICFAAQGALVLRWRALLEMLSLWEPWVRSWHSVFAGLFLTNFLPGTLGSDGIRIVLLTKSYGRVSTAIGAIAYERLMQLGLYALVVSLAALWPAAWLEHWLRTAIVSTGIIASALLILILYWLGHRSMDREGAGRDLLHGAWRLLAAVLIETGRMQTHMRRHRRAAIGFWAASLLNAALIFAIWSMVLTDIGHEVGMPTVVIAVGCAAIVAAVPISLNGLGIFEVVLVALFGLIGIPASHVFLLALIVRALFLASSLVGLPSAVLLWREQILSRGRMDCARLQ